MKQMLNSPAGPESQAWCALATKFAGIFHTALSVILPDAFWATAFAASISSNKRNPIRPSDFALLTVGGMTGVSGEEPYSTLFLQYQNGNRTSFPQRQLNSRHHRGIRLRRLHPCPSGQYQVW